MQNKPKICLNMIVKDEAKVIARCLESVKPIIDSWVIVDTGSSDGTKQIIKQRLKNIPGKIYDRPFVNFGHNRNEALNLAKQTDADYILFMDADEILVFNPEFKMPKLDMDWYLFITQEGGTRGYKPLFIRAALDWEWKGIINEEVYSPNAITQGIMSGVFNNHFADGSHATDPKKNKKNIAMLEKGLVASPNDSRITFQLGLSHKLDGNLDKALEYFTKRSALEGWDQETYCTLYEIGKLNEMMQANPEQIINSYSRAYHYRPQRAEPLYSLANYFLRSGNPMLTYILAKYAKDIPIPLPDDKFMLENWIYDFGVALLCIDAAALTGKYSEALDLCHNVLAQKNIPDDVRNKLERNRVFICDNLSNEKLNGPDVYLLTMKKSGTHMMTKFLRLLMARNDQEYDYIKATSKDYRAKHIIESPSGYKIQFGHLPYEKHCPLYHQIYGKKKILLVRDPRDVLISGSHFIPKIFQLSKENYPPSWAVDYVTIAGPFLERFAKMPLSDRLSCMITQKVPDSILSFTPEYYQQDQTQFIPPFDFALQIPAAVDYMNSPNTLLVRFEDLIGPQGGGSEEAQRKCFERIANFIGASYNSSMYEKLSKDLYGQSFTFRKGQSKTWEKLFSENNKEIFKKHFGEDLIKMGYEDSANW